MKCSRVILIPLLLVLLGLTSGCGLRQKYRVDRDGEKPGKNISQSQRISANQNSKGPNNTKRLIELGRLIQSYLGRPYSGKSKYDKGLDCSQFVQELFKKFNGTLLPRMVKDQIKSGHSVSKGDIQYGDLVFFRTERRNLVSHVGVYVGFNEFVHSSTSSGIIISSLKEKYWKKRFLGGRRIIR